MEIQGIFVALEALVGIAMLKAKQRNIEQALELTLLVLNHPASLPETKNNASALRMELEAQLTPLQIEAIQARAREITFETVVEDLLNNRENSRLA